MTRDWIGRTITVSLLAVGVGFAPTDALGRELDQELGRSPARGAADASTDSSKAVDATPFFFALSVADIELSVEWYSRVFDFEVVREVDLAERELRIRLLRRDGGFLELIETGAARDLSEVDASIETRYQLRGVFKIGFVVEDLETTRKRLGDLGVPLRGEIVEEADGSMRSLQVEDPDGNILQLFEILSK